MKTRSVSSTLRVLSVAHAAWCMILLVAGSQLPATAASVSGQVFFDLNRNGVRDTASEYGLPEWTIQLAGAANISVTTDANGNFTFSSLAAGTYTVSAVNPTPWVQSLPAGGGNYSLTLSASGVVTGEDFGVYQPPCVPPMRWQRNGGGNQADTGGFTVPTFDGGFAVAYTSESAPNHGGTDFMVTRFDAAGNALWTQNYGGPGNETLTMFKVLPGDEFILAGITDSDVGGNKTSPNYGLEDFWIVRLHADGTKDWEFEAGGDSNDEPWGGMLTSDGGFLVCGTSYSSQSGTRWSPSFGDSDGWVIKLYPFGALEWESSFGGSGYDGLYYPVENPMDGSFLIAGDSASAPGSGGGNKSSVHHGNGDYALVKIDTHGNYVWDRSFGGTSIEQNQGGLGSLPNGDVVLCGFSASGATGNKTAPSFGFWDCWLVRVSNDGNTVPWDRAFGGSGYEDVRGLQVVCATNILIAGASESGISGNKVTPRYGSSRDAWVALIGGDGVKIWDQTFGGSADDRFTDVSTTTEGRALLAGRTTSSDGTVNVTPLGQADIWVMELGTVCCPYFRLVSASADCAQGKVTVDFSGSVNPAMALVPANYTLSGGATVQSASWGASTLTVVLDVAGLAPGVTYTLSVSPALTDNYGNVLGTAASQLNLACMGEIRGRVFSDQNTDCTLNGPDFALFQQTVMLTPGPLYTLSDAQGYYSFTGLNPGAYTVQALVNAGANWAVTCPLSGVHSLSLGQGQSALNNDFAFHSTRAQDCPDLWVNLSAYYPGPKLNYHVGGSTPCCGTNFFYRLDFGNAGTLSALLSGSITLLLPPNCSFVSAFPAAVQGWTATGTPGVQGAPVTVSFLPPFQFVPPNGQWSVDIEVHLDCDITQTCEAQKVLLAQAVFLPLFGDCDWLNNKSDHQVSPCCSYDPNVKTVAPKGCGPQGFVPRGQELTYTVQFQNIGGGPASLVRVRDRLDDDLDLSTLKVIAASHANHFQINGRELLWTFPNINLASAAVDEPRSHGYVKYRVRPFAAAPAGTVITNSAKIYFDANAPITTSITTNTLTDDPVPVAAFAVAAQPGTGGMVQNFTYTGGTVGGTFDWYFGPDATPQTSTATSPSGVVFSQPGPHLVSLRTQLAGCESEPAIHQIWIGQPRLNIARVGADLLLSWQGDGYQVLEATNLTPTVQWTPVLTAPSGFDDWHFLPLPPASGARFYRLEQAP